MKTIIITIQVPDELAGGTKAVVGRELLRTDLPRVAVPAAAGPKQRVCSQCGKPGHRRDTCGRTAGDGEPRIKTNEECANCGKRGHEWKECPEK